jgi:hypothetical protein
MPRGEQFQEYDMVGEFIDGLAEADFHGQMFHVTEDGKPAYDERFEGVMPFSDGLAAVEKDGECFHITPEGKPAYQARFLDTAPFRNGLAWVQAKDGRWTQIDKRGIPVTRWYDNSEIS